MINNIILNIKSFLFENKGLKQTIFKNTFWLVLAEIIDSGISFLVIVWLARNYGPSVYGQWAFSLSFVSFFVIFADFGLSTLVIREVARDKVSASSYIDNILAIKIFSALVSLFLMFVFINFLGRGQLEINLVYFLGIFSVINTFGAFFHAIFKAYEKMQYETIARIIQSVLLLILIIIFSSLEKSIIFPSFAYIASSLLGAVISLILVKQFFSNFFLKMDIRIIKKILVDVWPISLSSLAVVLYYYFAPIFLGIMRSKEEVGLYNVAFQTSLLISPLSTILFSSFFPRISLYFKEKEIRLKNVCSNFVLASFMVAVPMCIGGIIVAPNLISFLYKWSYNQAILPFQILILSSALGFISSAFSGCLLAFNEQKKVLYATTIGVILNILLNILLIPIMGIVGASISYLISTFIVLVFVYIDFIKIVYINILDFFWKPFFSSIIMLLGLFIAKALNVNNAMVLVLLGVIIYFVSIYLSNSRGKRVLQSI